MGRSSVASLGPGSKQEIELCTIAATGTDAGGDARFDRVMPAEMVKLGMPTYVWGELIGEANQAIQREWFPRAVWSLCFCCAPFYFYDIDRAVGRRGRKVVEGWVEEARLPKGLRARFLYKRDTSSTRKGSRAVPTVYRIEFFYHQVIQVGVKNTTSGPLLEIRD